jgi:hypothetical protein
LVKTTVASVPVLPPVEVRRVNWMPPPGVTQTPDSQALAAGDSRIITPALAFTPVLVRERADGILRVRVIRHVWGKSPRASSFIQLVPDHGDAASLVITPVQSVAVLPLVVAMPM